MDINNVEINYTGKIGGWIDRLSLHNGQGHFIYESGDKRYLVEFPSSAPDIVMEVSGGYRTDPSRSELKLTLSITTDDFKFYPLFVPEAPKKMTMTEIEKELGYKVSIIDK